MFVSNADLRLRCCTRRSPGSSGKTEHLSFHVPLSEGMTEPFRRLAFLQGADAPLFSLASILSCLLFKKIRDILPIFVHIVVEFDGLSIIKAIGSLAKAHPAHPLAAPSSKVSQVTPAAAAAIPVSHHISSVAEPF